ncbi:tetratricopeptide repeat protein [Candidatus Colwellia aromaticivorans]|uniref:tetratricopeptide repeat protein n=1 Tax=Candidatus Colwellia aromaticivorans TaxID=2267621 RepID=UPI000DF17F25|nr:tetratricopeptide repeat protein [Candidatus Colwellia aromaticivorans]
MSFTRATSFTLLIFFTLFIIVFTFSNIARATESRDIRHAEKLLAAGDYDNAFEKYQRLAKEKNNSLAKLTMAMFYDYGWGRVQDRKNACLWYEQAAKHEVPVAADALGSCFENGVHQKIDYAQAAIWYQKAADLGYHLSFCHLGALYVKGFGVVQDAKKGANLCKKSAEQGSVPAMLQLGQFNLLQNTDLTNKRALDWYAKAASYHSDKAQYQLGVMLRDGIGIDANNRVALEWFEQSAAQGYVPAYYQTALLYYHSPKNPENNLWDEKELAKAFLWLSASIQRTENIEEIEKSKQMLSEVINVMPATWTETLDNKLQIHLNKYPLTTITKAK